MSYEGELTGRNLKSLTIRYLLIQEILLFVLFVLLLLLYYYYRKRYDLETGGLVLYKDSNGLIPFEDRRIK